MASTYTPNSGIEKIGTGEQSGSWGDTTNINFDIIDRAMSGVGTITLSGTTHTLTTSDGSASEGHYKVLILSGSPSGTNTITISPNDQGKMYVVYNGSGQTATFTQGSGGNISVANGKYGVIFADGAGAGAKVYGVDFDVLADTTPQLGGNLDLNSNNITGTGDIDITGTITSTGALDTGSSAITTTGTVNAGTVDLGDWTVTESAGVLYFATGGTDKMKLDASGNLTVVGNVTAYGTV
jgi:hypothetical protein